MSISDADVIAAAHAVAGAGRLEANASDILEDAYLLTMAFTDRDEYLCAIANTVRALEQLSSDVVSPSKLKYDHKGWLSYHYQHRVEQGARADMRIVFRRECDGIRLRAFGHRSLPIDFYLRIAERRQSF